MPAIVLGSIEASSNRISRAADETKLSKYRYYAKTAVNTRKIFSHKKLLYHESVGLEKLAGINISVIFLQIITT
jgi:hypothetical protein